MQKITAEVFQQMLVHNEKFAEYIIRSYPDLEADIRSYRSNTNCSCRQKIATYFSEHETKISRSIQLWAEQTGIPPIISEVKNLDHLNVIKTTLPAQEWVKYKDVIGEIVEILPDPTEYKRIISIARSEWLYNGINILETVKLDSETKKESVVWLLLFY